MSEVTYLAYMRTSTQDQNLDMQRLALEPFAGSRCYSEQKSGMSTAGRNQLTACIEEAKRLKNAGENVAVIVYSLSRLGRRVVDVVAMVEDLQRNGIGFRSLSEQIDTSTPMGRAFLSIVAALAQCEAETLAVRTKDGLKAARARGVQLGRRAQDHSEALAKAKELIASGVSVRDAGKVVGISHTTLLRLLKAAA